MGNNANEVLSAANNELIYNIYAYVADLVVVSEGDTFGDIVDNLIASRTNLEERLNEVQNEQEKNDIKEKIDKINILENAKKNNPDIAESRMIASTKDPNGLNAFAFESPNGDVSVVFRGTAKGEWIDNGEGLTGVPESNVYEKYGAGRNLISSETVEQDYATDQQVQALNWFNELASRKGWNESTNITISGHSKGGNKAQFVTINSPLVDECYSFDGQGFSPEAVQMFRDKYGDAYDERRAKIVCVAANNDYVNVLGERIALPENVYFVEAPLGEENVIKNHYVEAMVDENGNLNPQCEQGEFSKYIQGISDELMKLEPLYRQYATMGIMQLAQWGLGKGTPVNGDSVPIEMTVLGTILTIGYVASDGGEKIIRDCIENFKDKVDRQDDIIGKAGVVLQGIGALALGGIFVVGGQIVVGASEVLIYLVERLKEISADIYAKVSGFISSVKKGIESWYNKNFNKGYQYATSNPCIQLNTALLRTYASRLQSINNRIAGLDRRMDALYWKVGLQGLWDLMKADALTGYSWRLSRCINYLNDTAADFEAVERELMSQL